jgi:hypothetical protein
MIHLFTPTFGLSRDSAKHNVTIPTNGSVQAAFLMAFGCQSRGYLSPTQAIGSIMPA